MKKHAILAAFVILLLAAPGRAQSKHIHENVDPYTGLRTLLLEVSTHTCHGDPSFGAHDPDMHVLFSAHENADKAVSYLLIPELDRGDALSLRSGGTMDALINGEPERLTTPMGSTVTTSYSDGRSYLHETIPFVISKPDLIRLSNTAMFQFRVNGPHQSVQRCTDAKTLHDLAEFIAASSQYGPPSQPAPPASLVATRSQPATTAVIKTIRVSGIATYACPAPSGAISSQPIIQLGIVAELRADRTVKYFIVTDLTNLTYGKPLDLPGKTPLETEIGGLPQTFLAPHRSSLSTLDGSQSTVETIEFHLDRRDIVALSKSPTFRFRIDGPQQTVERCTDLRHFDQLPQFLANTAALYDHPVPDTRHP